VAVVEERDVELLWTIRNRRNLVGRGRMGLERAALVPPELFGGQPTHSLDEAAFYLPQVDRRVDGPARVVQDVGTQQAVFAGQGVDDDFGTRGRVDEVIKWTAGKHLEVVMDLGRLVETRGPQRNARHIGLLNEFAERHGALAAPHVAVF